MNKYGRSISHARREHGDTILLMASYGMSPRKISKHLSGVVGESVIAKMIRDARLAGEPIPYVRPRSPVHSFRITHELSLMIAAEAHVRRRSVQRLISDVLEAVFEGGIVDAVLDEDETVKNERSREECGA